MYLFLVSLATYFVYIFLKYKKSFFILNKNNYKIKTKQYLLSIDLFSLILVIILFNTGVKIANISVIIFYTILSLTEIYKKKNYKLKINKTDKITILVFSVFFIVTIIFMMCSYDNYYLNIYYIVLILIAYLSYFILFIIRYIQKKLKKLINK